jgi:hypothetical protein
MKAHQPWKGDIQMALGPENIHWSMVILPLKTAVKVLENTKFQIQIKCWLLFSQVFSHVFPETSGSISHVQLLFGAPSYPSGRSKPQDGRDGKGGLLTLHLSISSGVFL